MGEIMKTIYHCYECGTLPCELIIHNGVPQIDPKIEHMACPRDKNRMALFYRNRVEE
jgi:hypothetical protein